MTANRTEKRLARERMKSENITYTHALRLVREDFQKTKAKQEEKSDES